MNIYPIILASLLIGCGGPPFEGDDTPAKLTAGDSGIVEQPTDDGGIDPTTDSGLIAEQDGATTMADSGRPPMLDGHSPPIEDGSPTIDSSPADDAGPEVDAEHDAGGPMLCIANSPVNCPTPLQGIACCTVPSSHCGFMIMMPPSGAWSACMPGGT